MFSTWQAIYYSPQPCVAYVGRILPAPHDRLVDAIQPCAVCGFTGEINDRGVRSVFVECSVCGKVDAHSACAFGHATPSADDDFVCQSCHGNTVTNVEHNCTDLPVIPIYAMLNEGVMMIDRVDPLRFPNIFKIENGPWVDACVVADAVDMYDRNVEMHNIRPIAQDRPLTWIENWGTQDVSGMYPEEIGVIWHRGAACTLEDCQYYDESNLTSFFAALRSVGDGPDVDGWVESWVADEECFPYGLPTHPSRSSRRMHTNAQGLGTGGLCVQNHTKVWWEGYFTDRLREMNRAEQARYGLSTGGSVIMNSTPVLCLYPDTNATDMPMSPPVLPMSPGLAEAAVGQL